MALNFQKNDPILLGAGELYICKSSEIVDLENLTEEEESQLINIGAIESGCTITIEDEWENIESANRGTVARMRISRGVSLQTGVMTWVMENVASFLLGADFEEDTLANTKKMTIGNDDIAPECYIRFIHDKRDGGQLICNIYKGMFDDSLELDFNKENPVTVNYSFSALTNDKNNYVEFIETFADSTTGA